MTPKVGVFCFGNPAVGDDAAGPMVAESLTTFSAEPNVVVRALADPADLVHALEGLEVAYLVDAVAGGTAGGIVRLDWPRDADMLAQFRCGRHSLSVGESLRLAEVTGVLPQTIRIVGIIGSAFEQGRPASEDVARAVQAVSIDVEREVKAWISN